MDNNINNNNNYPEYNNDLFDMNQDLNTQRYTNRRYDYDNRFDYNRRYDNRYDNRYDYRYDHDRYYRYPYCDRYGNCENPIWWLFWPLFFL